MPNFSSQLFRRVVVVASALAGVIVVAQAAQTTKPAPVGSAKSAQPATNVATAAPVAPPKSVFYTPTSMQDPIKDPFFPQSTRLRKAVPVPTSTTSTAPVVMVKLELKGISGTSTHRLAIINSHTYGLGEEAELNAGNDRTRIKVVDIKNDSVVVEVNGERQVLHLRSGL